MCCRSLWREGGEGGGGGREERREGEEERREGEEGRREGEERANQEPRGGSPIKADVQEGLFPAHTATTYHKHTYPQETILVSECKQVDRDSHYLPPHQSDCCHGINQIALILSYIYQLSYMTHLLWRQVEVMKQPCVCTAGVRRERVRRGILISEYSRFISQVFTTQFIH